MPSARHDPSPEFSGCKRAVCIGINYRQGKEVKLNGSILDAGNIRDFLMRQGYKADGIRMLTDDTEKKPTKSNIIEAMSWLVQSAKPGDSLFLHYSGHGGCVPDQNGDETDGQDEVAFDLFQLRIYVKHWSILYQLAVGSRHVPSYLPGIDEVPNATLILPGSVRCKICWSGATDDQLCTDTPQGGLLTQPAGDLVKTFIKHLEEKPKQSYQELLHSIRKSVKHKAENQTPQLSSSHQIRVEMDRQLTVCH
ncbi:caspase domain-containing protein [Armillaria novae-zelandiae]|uniref:Caspase domain-containing protein n=1 Tax=Armillaria novae-zelandiae TaxID=153914 RepID=A0AA39P0Q4_9AGAR|nr:caspase domain-containing protein [Armillaria novae-zelandiae]